MEMNKQIHKSVMPDEAVENLVVVRDGIYVDATLGLGGHSRSILDYTKGRCRVIGLDVDESAIDIAAATLSSYNGSVIIRNRNFSDIDAVLNELNIESVDGIIADLGMSTYQIESSERGFSFSRDEPLDMRMDARLRFTAYDLVNEMSSDEIARVIKQYGEEKWARRIAQRIVSRRADKPISTSGELASLISEAIPRKFHPRKIHPATKSFQALRIAVNNELENIKEFINKSVMLLNEGGRLVVISFHSLEDRIVKKAFQRLSSPCVCPPDMPRCGCGKKSVLKVLTRSPIVPGSEEIRDNPRSRSAKMRVAERT